jgi:arabinofuranosyltransferase
VIERAAWPVLLGVLLVMHITLAGFLIWNSSVDVPGHGRYFLLQDDAMISMRYAHNLARGLGLVWNQGERVEGFTNPAWTIYMAVPHLLPLSEGLVPLVIQVSNVLLDVGVVLVTGLLVRQLDVGPERQLSALLAMFGVALSAPLLLWSVAGFETALQTLLVTIGLALWLRDDLDGNPRPLAFVFLALSTWVRPDSTVVFLCASLVTTVRTLIIQSSPFSNILSMLANALALPLALIVAPYPLRWVYYHDLFPNTYYLKVVGFPNRPLHGIQDTRDFLAAGSGLIVFVAVVWLWRTRGVRVGSLLAVILAQSAYVTLVGGDAFEQHRFFVLLVPVLAALAAGWVSFIRARLQNSSALLRPAAVCLGGVLVLLPSVSGYLGIATTMIMRANGDRLSWDFPVLQDAAGAGNTILALYLRDHFPRSSSVAVFWAGVVPYYTDWSAVDLLGKTDPHIARLPVVTGQVPGHNKWDFTYSLGTYRPQFVVGAESRAVAERAADVDHDAEGDYAFASRLYRDPTFVANYAAHPLDWPLSRTFLAVYERGA